MTGPSGETKMNSSGKARMYGLLAAWILLPLLGYFGLRYSSFDLEVNAPHEHFYIVSLVAALAVAVAMAVGVVAVRIRNIKVSFLSLAYVSLGALFILHGLSTPGFLIHHYELVGNTAQLSVILASFWLWLSSVSADHKLIRKLAEWQKWLLPAWCVILLLLAWQLWIRPEILNGVYLNETVNAWIATAIVVMMNTATIIRNLETYLVSRFPLQLAIVYSTGWMLVAQLVMVTGQTWLISWWLYHFLLLASVIVMVGGIFKQYLSTGSIADSLRLLFRADPRDWIQTYISPRVKELIHMTEAKDAYTAGHNFRVTMYSIKLGEELGLPASKLRALAIGGIVHDIGKLDVPDVILNKPGKLTEEERSVIEQHPVSGYNLCRELGFMPEELAVIRSHHEKWDGKGYPDGLAGEQIPLVARIAAVADVYDALTSSRSYRSAMTHEEAMSILVKGSGRHFDPHCIKAWKRLVRQQGDFFHSARHGDIDMKLDT
jgi:putative nucleotidyltransferase with HDIG domain